MRYLLQSVILFIIRVQSARGSVRGEGPHGSCCDYIMGGALPGATQTLPGPGKGVQETGEAAR